MENKMKLDDETLTAFADGELAEARMAEIRQALAADPALAARVEALRRAREAVAALRPEPVPAALEARIRALAAAGSAPPPAAPEAPETPRAEEGGKVVDLASRRRRIPVWQALTAAAAALALGFGLGQSFRATPDGGLELAALLDALPSGRTGSAQGAEIAMVASFHDGAGALCREYETREGGRVAVNVACRGAGGWEPRLVLAMGAAEGYVPASSFEILDAWMTRVEAGPPLGAAEEAAALKP